ncbi:hypothetical protein jhhlp_006249 [Lomentospora prolificans]|uniref:F-box domain-containing protein n=1 Tax=Lomentospora prolificans TaxID=41688 RepID=A0A2N3N5C6_9PEZI|nr:hypothetical protein jhhlp_006249 [Lomentospora prolificans]
MNLYNMPVEIMLFMVDFFDPDDVFHLGLTCKALVYLVNDRHVCRRILLRWAKFSPEALQAQKDGDYSRAFRTIWKRRRAITMAEPYTAAIVAEADCYIYTNGVLCYTTNRSQLRVRNLRRSSAYEVVINVRAMLASVPGDLFNFKQFRFYPIYYAAGILSCIYSSNQTGTTVLLVLRPATSEIITTRVVERHPKVIVRNTDEFLLFFVSAPWGGERSCRWHIYQLDIENREWFPEIVLEDFRGKDIDCEICFEIIDEYLYAVSAHLALDEPESDDASIGGVYHALRFPIGRRQLYQFYPEGDLPQATWEYLYSSELEDFRWKWMQIGKNESSGVPTVVEIRREFLANGYHNRRSCYKRELKFDGSAGAASNDPPSRSVEIQHDSLGGLHDAVPNEPAFTDDRDFDAIHRESSIHGEPYYQPGILLPSIKSDLSATSETVGQVNPGAALGSTPTTHHGDTSETIPNFPYHQCFVRSYFPSCDSFVDMVSPVLRHTTAPQELRLRIMSRKTAACTWGYDFHSEGCTCGDAESTVRFWPRDSFQKNDRLFRSLDEILNPPGYSGDVEATADYGSLIYAVAQSGNSSRKVLVYIGFDPSVNLYNLRPFHKSYTRRQHSRCQKERSPALLQLSAWARLEDCRTSRHRYQEGFHFFA